MSIDNIGLLGLGKTKMREEHADIWLGFEQGQVRRYFAVAGLEGYGYEPLGMQ